MERLISLIDHCVPASHLFPGLGELLDVRPHGVDLPTTLFDGHTLPVLAADQVVSATVDVVHTFLRDLVVTNKLIELLLQNLEIGAKKSLYYIGQRNCAFWIEVISAQHSRVMSLIQTLYSEAVLRGHCHDRPPALKDH